VVCNKCGKDRFLVNKKYQLCDDCNYERLHNETRYQTFKRKSKIRKPMSDKTKNIIAKDELAYEYWFNNKLQVCEECDEKLPNVFRDKNGKVVARYRYSHIITKASRPDLRYHRLNCNILCLECHRQWETGDRRSMKIFESNELIINDILKNPYDSIN